MNFFQSDAFYTIIGLVVTAIVIILLPKIAKLLGSKESVSVLALLLDTFVKMIKDPDVDTSETEAALANLTPYLTAILESDENSYLDDDLYNRVSNNLTTMLITMACRNSKNEIFTQILNKIDTSVLCKNIKVILQQGDLVSGKYKNIYTYLTQLTSLGKGEQS